MPFLLLVPLTSVLVAAWLQFMKAYALLVALMSARDGASVLTLSLCGHSE